MAVKAPRSFGFVPADDFGRPKATDRKFIRSHCMRGKNKKKDAYAVAAVDPPLATYEMPQATSTQFPLLSLSRAEPSNSQARYSLDPLRWDAGTLGDKAGNAREVREAAETASILPRAPPVDLSLVTFAGEVDGHSRELLFKFFNVARHITYPVDFCVDFNLSRTIWFQWLSHDVAYLHSVLLTTSVIHDFVMQRPPAKTTYFHLRKTIAFLNEHLSDSAVSLRDSTVAVVINLAGLADVFGDYAAARAHIAGLQQMVRLRGGLEGFRDNTKLHIKIRRLDLSFSLNTGEHPQFFTNPISWAPIFDGLSPVPVAGGRRPPHRAQSVDSLGDRRLAAVFLDLQHFAGLMNAATDGSNRRLRDTDFQNFTSSIQYRLLQLQGTLDDDMLSECVRLAMLAFLTTTFQIPGTKVRHPYLASRFRECCRAVDAATPQRQDLLLWLLTVGAISVYGADEPWLRQRWLADVPAGLAWPETRRRLQDIMWISAIHDKPGRSVFEAMSQREGD